MKLTELLDTSILCESHSGILYHYTDTMAALDILQSGKFKLSSTLTSSKEGQFTPRYGYDYFMSTTRSKLGSYHSFRTESSVMFVLDGLWFGYKYIVKPTDFFLGSFQGSKESEDRIFSKEPTIPITSVIAIHIFIEHDTYYSASRARKILILAKQKNIPIYIYDKFNNWKLQNTKKSITIQQASKLLAGKEPAMYHLKRTPTMYHLKRTPTFDVWFELIHKKSMDDLSKDAYQLMGSILNSDPSVFNNALKELRIWMDIHRKPVCTEYEYVNKLIKFIRSKKLNTLSDFLMFLKEKWSGIDSERH